MSQPLMTAPQVLLAGSFGSGKTEVALNLACWRAEQGDQVRLVDLDVVTPAFRARDLLKELASRGVEVISPQGEAAASDLPALDRRVEAVLTEAQPGLIMDVGGDPVGLKVLGRLRRLLAPSLVCLVVNPFRQTFSRKRIDALIAELYEGTGLAPAGLVANPNLGAATRAEDVLGALPAVFELAEALALPVFAVTYWRHLDLPQPADGPPFLPLERFLGLPWEADD
jgi:hypothetical protein